MINFNGIQKKEKIKDLVPFEENPRQLTEKQAKDLCEKLGRRCNMMEIDPLYVQVIIDRWEKFTGNRVVKADG